VLAHVALADRVALSREHAQIGWGAATLEENLRIDRHVLELAEEAGDQHAAGFAEAYLAQTHFASGHDDEARALVESAIGRLEPLGESRELAYALRTLGWYHWRRGEWQAAEPLLRRAVALARRFDDPVLLANAVMDLGVTLSGLGREGGVATTEEAYRLARSSGGDFAVLTRAYTNYPDVHKTWTSDFGLAEEITAEGVDLARKAGAPQILGWLLGNLSDLIYVQRGPLDETVTLAREAIELAEAVGDEPLLCMRLSSLGVLLAERGATEEARLIFDRAAALQTADPDPQSEMLLYGGPGLLASQQGDHTEAATQLRSALAIARTLHVDIEPELYPPLVRALLALGDRDGAESYRDLEGAVSPFGIALGLVVDGLLAPAPDEAVALLTDAVERLSDLPAVPEVGRALLDLAEAQSRAGIDPAPTLARAREVFTESQAIGWLPHVDAAEARG
jgi:tetratricopeptide (TPR) repeat protein